MNLTVIGIEKNDGEHTIEKLSGVNYASWSYQMKMILIDCHLWTIIEPGETEPSEGASAADKKGYISRQGKALAKVVLSICDEQQMHIRNLSNPKAVWEELQKLYAPRDSKFRTVQLRWKLYSLKIKNCESMENYLGLINKTVADLANIGDEIEDGGFSNDYSVWTFGRMGCSSYSSVQFAR